MALLLGSGAEPDDSRASAARLAAFARARPVSHVLGCHIEMSREPGRLYPLGATYQPDEHALQLGPEHVEELHEVCEAIGEVPRREVRADFVVQPVPPESGPV